MEPITPESSLINNNYSSLEIEQFQKYWKSYFANVPPIAHTFKHRFAERWLRIHSLSDAQRYPNDEAEWQVLLARQYQLFDDLIGRGQPLYVVAGYYANTPEPLFLSDELHISLNHQMWYALPVIPLDEDGQPPPSLDDIADPSVSDMFESDLLYYHVGISPQIWQPTVFESLLRAIAHDECRAFFVSFAGQQDGKPILIASYDGGVDVIFVNTHTRDNQKNTYQAWLSHREDGL